MASLLDQGSGTAARHRASLLCACALAALATNPAIAAPLANAGTSYAGDRISFEAVRSQTPHAAIPAARGGAASPANPGTRDAARPIAAGRGEKAVIDEGTFDVAADALGSTKTASPIADTSERRANRLHLSNLGNEEITDVRIEDGAIIFSKTAGSETAKQPDDIGPPPDTGPPVDVCVIAPGNPCNGNNGNGQPRNARRSRNFA